MKKLFTYGLLLSALFSQAQTALTVTATNKIEGYVVMKATDFKRQQDSLKAAAKSEALKAFAESMKAFSTVETVRETLRPDSVTGKTFQLSFKPLNAIIDRVIGISDGGNMELVENVDYTITKTTGKITLIGKGIPLFARKNLFAVYQKISP